jgi:hypothetical protein
MRNRKAALAIALAIVLLLAALDPFLAWRDRAARASA